MREVGVLEELEHRRGVVAEEDVVVAQVRDDAAGRLRHERMPMRLAEPRALRKIEEANALVALVARDDLAGRVLDAVSHDEELDRGSLLVERAVDRVREDRRVTKRRDQDRGVGHARAGQTSELGERRHDRGALGRARPRRRATAEMLDEHAQLSEERELARRLDASLLGLVGVRREHGYVLVPGAREHGDALGAVQLDAAFAHRRHGRDLERCATQSSASRCAAEADDVAVDDLADGSARRRDRAEHLERDGEVVRREHPDGVDVVVRDPQPTRVVEIPATAPSLPSAAIEASSTTPG